MYTFQAGAGIDAAQCNMPLFFLFLMHSTQSSRHIQDNAAVVGVGVMLPVESMPERYEGRIDLKKGKKEPAQVDQNARKARTTSNGTVDK